MAIRIAARGPAAQGVGLLFRYPPLTPSAREAHLRDEVFCNDHLSTVVCH